MTSDVGDEYADDLEDRLRQVHTLVPAAPDVLSIAIVDDETMSSLHEEFLQVEGTTDVLTFELAHDAAGRVTEGEIILCLDEARRQVAGRGHEVGHELLLYAVHGLLHLSGYNDVDEAEYAQMHAEEDRLLQAVGLGPVFRDNT